MKYSRKSAATILTTLLAVLAACGKTARTSRDGHLMLAAEETAALGMFPGSVSMEGCSGFKVGAMVFATAAHCVVDEHSPQFREAPSFKTGEVITVGNNADGKVHVLTVKKASIHADYLEYLEKNREYLKGEGESPALGKFHDVALIEVSEATPSITEVILAPLSTEWSQEAIVLTGYGCTDLPQRWADPQGPMIASAAAPSGEPLRFASGTFSGTEGSLLTVPHRLSSSDNGGILAICEGDSGSAVYRKPQEVADKMVHLEVIGLNIGRNDDFSYVLGFSSDLVNNCLMPVLKGSKSTQRLSVGQIHSFCQPVAK